MALVLDAGALIAIERSDRQLRAVLQNAHDRAVPVRTSAAVVGQVWRGGARQAVLARALAGVEVAGLGPGVRPAHRQAAQPESHQPMWSTLTWR